jgi:hypothetical protein
MICPKIRITSTTLIPLSLLSQKCKRFLFSAYCDTHTVLRKQTRAAAGSRFASAAFLPGAAVQPKIDRLPAKLPPPGGRDRPTHR